MSPAPLPKRLHLKPGRVLLVVNPPEGYRDLLSPLPEGVTIEERASGSYDAVHLFVQNRAALDAAFPGAFRALKPDGLLWISYPKRSSKVETDITRDAGWEVISAAGLRPVTQVSVDDIWSALRFRPRDKVGA